MVTVGNLQNYSITRSKSKIFGIAEKILSSVLKSNFNNFKFIQRWHVHIGKPIKHIHFITAACLASTVIFTARDDSVFSCSTRASHPANLYSLLNPVQYLFYNTTLPSTPRRPSDRPGHEPPPTNYPFL